MQSATLAAAALFLAACRGADGHGHMTRPLPRNAAIKPYNTAWRGMNGTANGIVIGGDCYSNDNLGVCNWFANAPLVDDGVPLANNTDHLTCHCGKREWCGSGADGTTPLGDPLPWFPCGAKDKGCKKCNMPWRAPGWAPIASACGVLGASDPRNNPMRQPTKPTKHEVICAGGQEAAAEPEAVCKNGPDPDHPWMQMQGAECGTDGVDLPPIPRDIREVWAAGGVAEVAFGLTFNHGGGYQYRLCPAGAKLTEDCFAKTPLRFTGKSFVDDGRGNRRPITVQLTSEATYPPGSQWAKNPIPLKQDCYAAQAVDLVGWGPHRYSIVDEIAVPDVPAGDYVVSWRWDCEQTAEIWTNCADVTIVTGNVQPQPAPPVPVPPAPFGPSPTKCERAMTDACGPWLKPKQNQQLLGCCSCVWDIAHKAALSAACGPLYVDLLYVKWCPLTGCRALTTGGPCFPCA